MKTYTILAASLAIPMALASAQTTTTPPTTSSLPYIPLVGSSVSGTNGSTGNSTWFIDSTRNQVVFCVQSGGVTSGTFTCTAQAVPTTATGGGTTGGGTTDGGSTGGTGATGGAGGASAGILRSPFSR
jgi:hypothetical protein